MRRRCGNVCRLRGIPLPMEIGPRALDNNAAVLVRRDSRAKQSCSLDTIGAEIETALAAIQRDMLTAARDRREQHSVRGQLSYDSFREIMDGEGAFVYAGWCGADACEAKVKEETKATIRVLPDEEFRSAETPTTCLCCDGAAAAEALWAKAY